MIARLHRLARALLTAALPDDLRDAVIGDLDDEMHERIRGGATPRQAMRWSMRQAAASVPSALRLRAGRRQTARHSVGAHRMQNLRQDIRFAVRLMRKTPFVTCAAVSTLALGIGATTAIFSVVHATLLRELPFHEPDQIVRIYESFRSSFTRGVANPANFDFWERHARSFSHIAPVRSSSATLTGAGEPARISVQQVGQTFFDVIGVWPGLGRPFTDSDAEGSAPPVLVSYELWRTRFGSDPSITSRNIVLDGVDRPVAGVMPRGFRFPNETDVWVPLSLSAAQRANARSWFLGVVARLRPGVSIDDARAEMDTLTRQLQQEAPARQKDRGAYIVPLREDLVHRVADGVVLLQGAVGLVLLIAVANIANLLLARGAGRMREFGIRIAVGASRWRLVSQLLTESLLLGVAGAAAGCLLAVFGVRALVAFSPLRLPVGMEPAVDAPVLLFGLATGVAASVFFGLLPAIVATRGDVAARLQEHAGGPSGMGRRSGRLRSALVVAEVALAAVLLVGAGLLTRSFAELMAQEVGFTGARVLTATTTLPSDRYDTSEKRARFWTELFGVLHSLPGITAAGGSTAVPFSKFESQTAFRIVGREGEPAPGASIRTVHPAYFEALGIPVLAGRTLTDRDDTAAEPVVMVNEAFVRAHLGTPAVGQRIRLSADRGAPAAVIVGVAGDTRHVRLTEPPQPEIYRPLAQHPAQMFVLALRTSGDPRGAMSLLRAAVRKIDPDLPLEQMTTLDSLVAGTVADRRFYLTLMGFFAAAALVLSLVGVYAVMAYVVGLRTREIGIRLALGAAPADVTRSVVASGARLVSFGLALGAGGALLTSGVLESLLFGVTPRDPLTTAGAIVLLGLLGVTAAYAPARRAGKVDPIRALRT